MNKLNLRLFRMIRHHFGQFVAVAAVVAVGLLIYTTMSMAVNNLDTSVTKYYEMMGFADVTCELVRFPESALDELRKLDGVETVQGRIVQDVPLDVADKDERVRIRLISVPKGENRVNGLYTVEGKEGNLTDKDIKIIHAFAKARVIRTGDAVSPHIGGRTYDLTVKSIVSSPEFIYLMENEQSLLPDQKGFGVGYISTSLAQRVFGFENSYNQVLIRAEPGTNLDLLKSTLEKKMKKYGVRRIYTRKSQLSARVVEEEVKSDRQMTRIVPTIFLFVAAVIIAVMVQRMVRNDRIAIGVFKALGYRNRDIVLHYTGFSALVGVAGAIPGIFGGGWLSIFMAKYMTDYYDVPILYAKLYPEYYVSALLLTCFFCIGAGIWGARAVIHIVPSESMRPEPPRTGKRILLERFAVLWQWVPFTWKMVIRNIFRAKKRFVMIAMGIAITYAVTLVPIYEVRTFDRMFLEHYTIFQRMNYTLNFSGLQSEEALTDLKSVKLVQRVEPLANFPFEVKLGWRSKVVEVIGVRPDTQFYYFSERSGNRLKVPKNGILLSGSLAKVLDAKTGDTVILKSFIPDRKDRSYRVTGLVDQVLGLNAYMALDTMQSELLEPGWVTGAMLKTDGDIKQSLKKWKNIATVQSTADLIAIFQQFLTITLFSIGILVLFSFVLGFAIVYNTTMMTIHEREMEFSSLRVMGFGNDDIFKLILKENLLMVLLGLILGAPLGWWMVQSMYDSLSTELYTLKTYDDPFSFLISGGLTIIFVFMAQAATYGRIKNLDFIEALKNRMS